MTSPGMSVTVMKQRHSGDSYGYRFSAGGSTVVYTTDSEHRLVNPAETARFVELFRDADLVIFDAMYSLAESISVKGRLGPLEQHRRRRPVPPRERQAPVPVPP
jgi:hypothetical protein